MAEPRQRPIPVSRQERDRLDEHKRRYEEATGDRGDWGGFLRTISLLGLAALGVYGIARAKRRSTNSVTVRCPSCGQDFAVALPQPEARVVEAVCPYCDAELVVDLGKWEVSVVDGGQPFAEWEGVCPRCGNREVVRFVTRPPYWRETVSVRCSKCQTEFMLQGPDR